MLMYAQYDLASVDDDVPAEGVASSVIAETANGLRQMRRQSGGPTAQVGRQANACGESR